MKEITVKSWADFPEALQQIQQDCAPRQEIVDAGISLDTRVLFRGQADSNWKLLTTLERERTNSYTVEEYLLETLKCVNEIESVTGRSWKLKSYMEICDELKQTQASNWLHFPHYEYLAYLRHHGFPSPLLDWTTSPYIAAYFAFEQQYQANYCSVYVFIESPDGIKCYTGGNTLIKTHGHYITTHVRHFTQKAWYTTATRWDSLQKKHTFCPHDMMPEDDSIVMQDILYKIMIPRQERLAVLKQLEDYNINRYSLFQSEDALVDTLKRRIFEFGK